MNNNTWRAAWMDVYSGVRYWNIWGLMAWLDVRQRYRRSLIGPFWLTISMAISISALGLLYAHLFKVDTTQFIPFLGIGFVVWAFIANSLNEGCSAFIQADGIIKQIKTPLSIFVYRILWRNSIILFHNAIIVIALLIYFQINVSSAILWVIPGLLLLVLNLVWISLLFGMLATRFRDLIQIIASVVQIGFFITPINWKPEMLAQYSYLNEFNPFFHAVEVVRAPLLGYVPLTSYIALLGMLLVGGLSGLFFMKRYKYRLAYWL